MKCPTCGTEMKPLATSVYCPNDCDRVPDPIETEKTPEMLFFDIGDYIPDKLKRDLGGSSFIGPPDPPDKGGQLDWLDALSDALNGTD